MGLIEENHVYSYSQLSSFDECPYSYYLERIEGNPPIENPFAQYGTLMHSCIESWANKSCEKEKLPSLWEKEYPSTVTLRWPAMIAKRGYAEKVYQAGFDYLKNFDEFTPYTVVAAEKEFETELSGRPFRGVIDLVLRDPNTGAYIIVDHKSKTKSTFSKSEDILYRQLYLYSKAVLETYGEYPSQLWFNLFRENQIVKRPFDFDEYKKVLSWADNTIFKIENFELTDFLAPKECDFFCAYVCGMRNLCEAR